MLALNLLNREHVLAPLGGAYRFVAGYTDRMHHPRCRTRNPGVSTA